MPIRYKNLETAIPACHDVVDIFGGNPYSESTHVCTLAPRDPSASRVQLPIHSLIPLSDHCQVLEPTESSLSRFNTDTKHSRSRRVSKAVLAGVFVFVSPSALLAHIAC